jgi:succinyl-CoA synthetase alpha subunit
MSDALDQAETALIAALDAIRAAKAAEVAPARRLMPLKTAAFALGVSEKTARRRAKAGAGIATTRGWLVDLDEAEAMGVRS